MPKFSNRSVKNLESCDARLITLFEVVVKEYDCTVLCGHRSKEDQERAYNEGKSKLNYPRSKHNSYPSLAVDVVPYPISWSDTKRFYHFAGYVLGVSEALGIKIKWGGDWDGDKSFKDQSFHDLPHFELIEVSGAY